MADLPSLPFQSHFTEEWAEHMKAQGGLLQAVNYRSAMDLAISWNIIYKAWGDAHTAVDGGVMRIKEIDKMFFEAFIALNGGRERQKGGEDTRHQSQLA
jgi:hypothetical protein